MNIIVDKHGSIVCLVNEQSKPFLDLGKCSVKRASYVEPDNPALRWVFTVLRKQFGDKGWVASFTRWWPCLWRVNLKPVGGPILASRWRNRQRAIAAEVFWLNSHFL